VISRCAINKRPRCHLGGASTAIRRRRLLVIFARSPACRRWPALRTLLPLGVGRVEHICDLGLTMRGEHGNQCRLISKVYFRASLRPARLSLARFSISPSAGYYSTSWPSGLGAGTALVALTPLLLLIQAATALASVRHWPPELQYRDVKHAISFLIQVFMLATPVIYPASRLPALVQNWLFLNPMAVSSPPTATAYKGLR